MGRLLALTGVSIFSLCGVLAEAATPVPEMLERERISSAAQVAFMSEDFAELESVSKTYRNDKSRTSSGLWKLGLWYRGIMQAIAMHADLPRREDTFRPPEQIVERWLKKYPESPAAVFAMGQIHIARAWEIRGDGYASEVDPAAWAPFRKHIALARKNLEEHKKIASIDPNWYEQMLVIARAQSWDRPEFDRLLDEALDREPLYYPNYFSALDYLLPKWHGSAEEIDAFARAAMERTGRLEGEGMYARIYWFASQTEFKNDLFGKSRVSWPLMKAGFEDVIARYPDEWNLNNYAKFACLAKDLKKTRELFQRIGGNRVPQAWVPPALWKTCSEWALGTEKTASVSN